MFSAFHRKIICNGEVPKLFVRVANVRILGSQDIHTGEVDNCPKKSNTKTANRTEDKLINYKKTRINIAKIMASNDVDSPPDSEKKRKSSGVNFQKIGHGISILPWSCSGLETCVVVKTPYFRVAFDMGYPFKIAVTCEHVFISHGHMDHIASIVSHASKRNLYGMKPATYYMAEHLVEPIQQLAALYGKIHNDENNDDLDFAKLNIKPVDLTTVIDLPKKHFVKAFKTVHRVRSQGYIIYRKKKVLKPEYVGNKDIGQLIKDGVNVHSEEVIPEIAYTGDTTFETFRNPANTDLFKVKLLITEATYIDNETDKLGRGGVERANARGHTHVQEIIDNEKLFEKVSKILLIHFSDKYSVNYIRGKLETILPPSLKQKIILGTLWKETFG